MTSVAQTKPERRSSLRAWPLSKRLIKYFAGAVAASIVVWTLVGFGIVNIYEGTWPHLQETRVNVWLESVRTPQLNGLSRWGTRFSDTPIVIGLAVLFSVAAVIRWRRWLDAIFVFGSLATQAAVFLVVTLLVNRDRPPVEQLDGSLPTASFPSGHAGAATAFYGSLIVVSLWHFRKPLLRWLVPAMLVLFPISVIVSRLYRGMHYPSDIAAGVANGLISIAVMGWVLRMGLDDLRDRSDADECPPEALTLDMTESAHNGPEREFRDGVGSSIPVGPPTF